MHPTHPERPLIDWDLVLQLEPMTIAGALIGTDLNEKLPDIVLLVLMLVLLSVTAYKTLNKACKLYKDEEKQLHSDIEQDEEVKNVSGNNSKNEDVIQRPWLEKEMALQYESSPTKDTPLIEQNHISTSDGGTAEQASVDTSKQQAIKRQVRSAACSLVSLFVVITIIDLLEGSPEGPGGGPFGLEACVPYCYWISEGVVFTCIILFSLYVRSGILKRQEWGACSIRYTFR